MAKYWNEYKEQTELLDAKGAGTEPIYNSSGRKLQKYTKEVAHLLPYKPKLELADIKIAKVNKYSFIRGSYSLYIIGLILYIDATPQTTRDHVTELIN